MTDDWRLVLGEHGPGAFEETLARKAFLAKMGKLAAAGAVAGPLMASVEQAWARAEKASLGGDPVATNAVAAAKKYAGITLTTIRETGPQAADDKLFGGPLWEKLTGIKVQTIEGSVSQILQKQIAAHIAKTGEIDVVEALGGWIPDFADRGVIIPIDDRLKKYKGLSSLKDIHPVFRSFGQYKRKNWGFSDDGDAWALYYRKDIFGDPKLRKAYKAKFKRALGIPKTWDEMTETSQFITDQLAPKVYGQGMARALGNPGNYYYFYQTFRSIGGQFFDPKTMKAQINNAIGAKTMDIILKELKASPPGDEKFDFLTMWTTWLQGKTAMIYTWPPTGRISENYAQRDKAFSFLPKSRIVGKVGYAPVPTGHGWINGVVRAVSADSKNIDAAYLFIQWDTSPSISLQRVMLPYSLRDPYRLSHYRSKKYASLWPAAKEYLKALCQAADDGVIELVMPGAPDYGDALDRAMTAIYAGKDVQSTLDGAAKKWDTITAKLGVAKQRAAYANYIHNYTGSTIHNTAAAKGIAVKC
jgi:multiple sugar transport system substrate-binding protein